MEQWTLGVEQTIPRGYQSRGSTLSYGDSASDTCHSGQNIWICLSGEQWESRPTNAVDGSWSIDCGCSVDDIKAALQPVIWYNNNNMPLDSLPDRFDAVTHDELDRAVDKAASKALSGSLVLPIHYFALLHYIVKHSKGDLDPKYMVLEEAEALIDTYGEVQDMLVSAWERRSYREIRNLGACLTIRTRYLLANELLFDPPAILKAPRQEPKTTTPTSTTSADTLEG